MSVGCLFFWFLSRLIGFQQSGEVRAVHTARRIELGTTIFPLSAIARVYRFTRLLLPHRFGKRTAS